MTYPGFPDILNIDKLAEKLRITDLYQVLQTCKGAVQLSNSLPAQNKKTAVENAFWRILGVVMNLENSVRKQIENATDIQNLTVILELYKHLEIHFTCAKKETPTTAVTAVTAVEEAEKVVYETYLMKYSKKRYNIVMNGEEGTLKNEDAEKEDEDDCDFLEFIGNNSKPRCSKHQKKYNALIVIQCNNGDSVNFEINNDTTKPSLEQIVNGMTVSVKSKHLLRSVAEATQLFLIQWKTPHTELAGGGRKLSKKKTDKKQNKQNRRVHVDKITKQAYIVMNNVHVPLKDLKGKYRYIDDDHTMVSV